MGMNQYIKRTAPRGFVGMSAPIVASAYGFDSW
jgi:hypothetical protein